MATDRMTAAGQTHIFSTPEELARRFADWVIERAAAQPGRLAVCLSGGSTPKRLYELLATPPRLERFPWDRAHWFWADERIVPHDDPQSNFHLAWETMLRHAPVHEDQIHAMPTEGMPATECAARYEADLKRFYGADRLVSGRPLFDLTLLGLGDDGHTASLFPGSPALAERERWAVAVEKSPLSRITLTYPALEHSRTTAFLVAGEGKRDVLARARRGDAALPAARLRSVGAVYWFADRAAAGREQS